MPHFDHDGLSHYYEVHGHGLPVVMAHGAAVTFQGNFGACGWIEPLRDRGFQVIGIDARGHGGSDAPPDPSASGIDVLARDIVALLDHLEIDQAAIVGYSVGSALTLHALHTYPERFRAAALVATGDGLIGVPPFVFQELMPGLAEYLKRPEYPDDLPAHQATYWALATNIAGNRAGVAMMARGEFPPCTPAEAGSIDIPVLVVSGSDDLVLGTGAQLTASLGNGRYVEIAGANHFSMAIDATVQATVGDFLQTTTS